MAESTVAAPGPDPKERFYRRFQEQVTALQQDIDNLENFSTVAGERQDATDEARTNISRLSKQVQDASEYIPAYDQRTYVQAVKALSDKLNAKVAKLAPQSKFKFKPRAPDAAPSGLSSAASDPRRNAGGLPVGEAVDADSAASDQVGPLPLFAKNYNEELARPGQGIRKPSFSAARDIGIGGHTGLHILLPSSAARATSSGSLTDLKRCVVDMTVPTGKTGAPFASLALRNIERSLVVAGNVAGPTHITGVRDSIIVVASRQVRIHECKNVDLYLYCASHPIIEDCSEMRFAPIPSCHLWAEGDPEKNQWDRVDDFKWLKAEHSPNWSVLPEQERLPEAMWTKTVKGEPGDNYEDILRKTGVLSR